MTCQDLDSRKCDLPRLVKVAAQLDNILEVLDYLKNQNADKGL